MNTEKTLRISSASSAHTVQIGVQIGSILRAPQVIELIADLGGGKTTLVKGLALGLGYTGDVTSPTFTLTRQYQCRNGITLLHHDFYRLDSAGIMATELLESLSDPKSVNVVEWADSILNVLPKNRLKIAIAFDSGNPNNRLIEFSGPADLINKIKQSTKKS